jgi:hypothetical protein
MAKLYRPPTTHAFKAGSPAWGDIELAQCGRRVLHGLMRPRRAATCKKCLLVMATESKKLKRLKKFDELWMEARKLLE